MVSRRKILSRSRDDLNTEQQYVPEDEEDVWYQKDKLFKVSMVRMYTCEFLPLRFNPGESTNKVIDRSNERTNDYKSKQENTIQMYSLRLQIMCEFLWKEKWKITHNK